MLKRHVSLAILFICVPFSVYAQADRSTQSAEVQSFFLNPDLEGVGQNSVNLYSGDVNLPVSLLSVSGRGGLTTNVSAFYTSNIQYERDIWALEAPTSILGLGWSMGYDKIVRDYKNTGTVHDDDYYLVSGGSSNELIMTSSSSGIKTFEPKNFQPWKITYYSGDERWEIIKEDGITYVFGGGKSGVDGSFGSDGNSVQWGVKWNNWIGSSIITTDQQQFAIAWNLSKVQNTWGDELTYQYLVTEEKVGRPTTGHASEGKNHTKASYLEYINTPEGNTIQFIYGNKSTDEYTDPYQAPVNIPDLGVTITGDTQVEVQGTGNWVATVVNEIGTVSYQWAYRYDENGGSWTNAGTNSSTFSMTNILPGLDDYDLQIRVTVQDNQMTTVSEPFPVTIIDQCELDCLPGPLPSYPAPTLESMAAAGTEEPDAYQEKYEDKYLSRISVSNSEDVDLYFLDFAYEFYGTAGQPEYKRLLKAVYHTYPNGETLPGLDFRYYGSGTTHPAALERITYPVGAEVTYTYSKRSIAQSNQKLTIDRPSSDYEDPRVWIASDYVVVTWNQVDDADGDADDDVWLKAYTWEGKWIEYDYGVIVNTGDYINSNQNFEIFLSEDTFVFIDNFYEKSTLREVRIFRKDEKIPGAWGYTYKNVSTSNSFIDVVVGDEFIAISELLEDDITTYKWEGDDWSGPYLLPYSGTNSSGNDTFIGGNGNFIVINNEGDVGADKLQAFYLNELKEWTAGTSNTVLFESSVTNSGRTNRNYVNTGQSVFTLSLNGDDEGIFKLNEDYSVSNGFNIGNLSNYHNPVYINNNELIFFGESWADNAAKSYRYDGVNYKALPHSFALNTFTYSVGSDLIVKRGYANYESQEYGYHIHFDPNSSSWKSSEIISDNPPGLFQYLFTDTFANIYVYGRKGFYKNFTGGITEFGNLSAGVDSTIDYNTIQVGNSFIAYNTEFCSSGCSGTSRSTTNQLRIAKIKNGNIVSYQDIGGGNSIHDGLAFQYSDLVVLNTIVSSNQFNLSDATQLTLFRKVGDNFEGKQEDYPVTKIDVDNGYGSTYTDIAYTTGTATVDPSGNLAQYNKITTKVNGGGEGSTEYYFFNGLPEDSSSADFPSSGYTNAETHLEQVKGLVYKTKVLNASSNLVSETINHWYVYEEPILTTSDPEQLALSHYARQQFVETTTDGVYNYTQMWHSKGLLLGSLSPNYLYRSGSGNLNKDFITTTYTYPSALAYPELVALNIINQPIHTHTYIIDELGDITFDYVQASATTWKDWGAGKWAPHKTYSWKGLNTTGFNHAGWSGANDPPTSDWLKTSEIISRNSYGDPTEVKDTDGISSSTLYGFDGSKVLAIFGNAQATEVRYDGFDDIDNPQESELGWQNYSGNAWSVENGNLKGSKLSGNESYLHTSSNLNHSSSIIEFDFKFEGGSANDWLGLQFRLPISGTYWYDNGWTLKIEKDGSVSLYSTTTQKATGIIAEDLSTWRHLRLITKSDGSIQVVVDGVPILETQSTTNINNQYYGFIVDGATVLIDNFRVYPNDAVASSTGYDPVYANPVSATDANGYLTRLIRDENQRLREVQNAHGMVMSTSSTALSRQITGTTFSTTTPNASFQASFPSYNAIKNGEGEYGDTDAPEHWEVETGGTLERGYAEGYSGLHAIKLTTSSNEILSQSITKNDFLWQGKKYLVRFRVKKLQPFFTADPVITVSLKKTGSAVTSQTNFTLVTTDWYLFEIVLNTDGGQFFGWNDESMGSMFTISTNVNNMPLLIDEVYVGELEYGDESEPGYIVNFADGAGKTIQNQAWNGTNYTVSHTEYDDSGRPWKTWRPYVHASGGKYDASFASRINTQYPGEVHYSKREYHPDPLSRIRYVYPDGETTSEKISYEYSSDDELGIGLTFSYTQVTGLDGVKSRSYTDYKGQLIRTIQDHGTGNENVTSQNLYDPIARVSASRTPNYFDPPTGAATDWVATSASDFMGTNLTSTSPDAGTSKIKNDEQGRLRFSQSAQQAINELVSFTSYDMLGRPIVSGEATDDDFTGLNGETTEPFESNDSTAISFSAHDAKPTSGFPWSLFSGQTGAITLENTLQGVAAEAYKTNGKSGIWQLDLDGTTVTSNSASSVAAPGEIILGSGYTVQANATQAVESASKIFLEPGFHAQSNSSFSARIVEGLNGGDANDEEWQAVYYSYDFQGRLAKKWILTQDKPELRTELSYLYNDMGQMIRQHTKIGTDQELYHFYSYDIFGRIEKVYVSETSTRPTTSVITYAYDAEGKMTSKTYPDASNANLSYSYTDKGQLHNIAKAVSSTHFDMTLEYNTDGTIQSIDVKNNSLAQNEYSYSYGYNDLKQMTSANYSSVLDLPPHNSYDVKNITYDKNGNIISLDRYKGGNVLLDQLSYSYQSGTNKLSSVTDAVATSGEDWDAEDATHAYNMDGSMISNTKDGGGGFDGLSYGTNNLPVSIITDNGLEQVYRYNSAGWRISKESIDRSTGNVLSTEHYIMDGGINLAVTDDAGTVLYWNLYGNELLGRRHPAGEILNTTGVINSESESNNTQATADGPIGNDTDGIIGPGETDWFYFNVSNAGTITINAVTEGYSGSSEPLYWEIRKDGSYITDDEGSGTVSVTPGTYHLILTPTQGVTASDYIDLLLSAPVSSEETFYYVYDHLGSVRMVYDDNNALVAQYDYYPFGALRSSYVTETTKEGFTGKERDEETGLHYFGARYYDASLGRWNVTDPAGQFATPYGYTTNPVSYVDPDGQFVLEALALAVVAYNAVQTYNNSGGDLVYTAARTAIGLGKAFIHAGVASGMGAPVSTSEYIVNQEINSRLPQHEFNITDNFSVTASPAFALNPDGLSIGGNISASYTSGHFSASTAFGLNNFSYMANVSASYYGIGYGQTYYGGSGNDNDAAYGNQRVGAVSYSSKHFSFTWQNDGWARSGDRWRTNAIELNYRGYIVGTTLNTDNPKGRSSSYVDSRESPKWGKNSTYSGAWNIGRVFRTPLYFGFQQGHQVTRIGYSHSKIQDFIQNGWHKHAPLEMLRAPYFLDYQPETNGPYYYSGFYNPYSLYYR